MRSVKQHFKLMEDPLSNEYIQSLGLRLASQISTGNQSFRFFIVQDSAINAFAGPAGYIGINSGLILASKSEGELASVVAHEIAHVYQQHLIRSIEASQNMGLTTMAAIIAAIILGRGNGDVSQAVLASTIAGNMQQQLSFSRSHEQEADRIGIIMLAKAGYDPNLMADFFETLQKQNRYATANIPEFILTHPVTSSRIADARGRAAQQKTVQRDSSNDLYFQLIHARIKSLSSKNTSASSNFLRDAAIVTNKLKPIDIKNRYSQILKLHTLGHYKRARKQLQQLIKFDHKRVPYLISQAEIEISSNNLQQALNSLDNSLQFYPHNQALTMLYAQVLVRIGKPKKAMQTLKFHLRLDTFYPILYKLYANAAKDAGLLGEAFESLAEYYSLNGDTMTAIRHLKRALEQIDTDTHRAIRINARLSQLKHNMINKQAKIPERSGE